MQPSLRTLRVSETLNGELGGKTRQTGWLMPNACLASCSLRTHGKSISRHYIPEGLGFLIFPNIKSVCMEPAVHFTQLDVLFITHLRQRLDVAVIFLN